MFEALQTQIKALIWNIISWFFGKDSSQNLTISIPPASDGCISINQPGGLEELKFTAIGNDNDDDIYATVGYNIPQYKPPYIKKASLSQLKNSGLNELSLVILKIKYFSINYADICIRWGLYESAAKYVGWPIVPGFDFSGTVELAGTNTGFNIGDEVFGFTLFGAYSNRLLVPSSQIRKIKVTPQIGLKEYAAIPAVSSTALHAVSLAGGWPNTPVTMNRSALVHSAAGGVGTMLLQILKIQKYSPIVAVVGSAHKIDTCKKLGADYVINKSEWKYKNNKKLLWKDISQASRRVSNSSGNGKYSAIFDANGIETLADSYNCLDQNGHLVIYGFHSNLPKNETYLNPLTWIKMIKDVLVMPRYDPMELVLTSKTVSGFNLSFFSEEKQLIEVYMKQIVEWIECGAVKISADNISTFKMSEVRLAHQYIQSGNSVGKIIIET